MGELLQTSVLNKDARLFFNDWGRMSAVLPNNKKERMKILLRYYLAPDLFSDID